MRCDRNAGAGAQTFRSWRSVIEVAYSSANGLLDLIGDILDIACIESGRFSLNPERANLRRLVELVLWVFDGQVTMLTKLRNEGFRRCEATTTSAGDVGLIVEPQLAFVGEVIVPIFHEHPQKLVLCRKGNGLASGQTEKLVGLEKGVQVSRMYAHPQPSAEGKR